MLEISIEESAQQLKPLNQHFLPLLNIFVHNLLEDFECGTRFCSLLICDDRFISSLNKQYRNKDYATDVLSFAFDDDEEFILPDSPLGDIIISGETAFKQSLEFGVCYEEEFARLTIHGVLHLLGYDHELSQEAHQEMFELQDHYMQKFMKIYNNSDSALI